MLLMLITLILLSATVDGPTAVGRIQGNVVSGTHGDEPLADVVVVLRAGQNGALIPVADTRTDMYGKFVFEDVPLDPAIVYLPGADCRGVHYPGQRIRLDSANRVTHVRIVAFDAVDSPSPLIARRHDIDIDVRQDVMEISETLFVMNPSRTTYVGAAIADIPPVTLRLSLPKNFDRVTFGGEFYGRRFRIVDHQPVTEIPWPPGERELRFSYRIPLEGSGGEFQRRLDMPCSEVRIRVRGMRANEASSNLPLATGNPSGDACFTSNEELPAGHTVELRVGTLPFPWMRCARWGSLVMLAALAMATVVVARYRDALTCLSERSE